MSSIDYSNYNQDRSVDVNNCLKWSPEGVVGGFCPRKDIKTRFFCVTLGPTGSGKSKMAEKLKKEAQKINPNAYRNSEWSEKVLDDYVEEDPNFFSLVLDILNATEQNLGNNKVNDFSQLLEKINTLDACSIYDGVWFEMFKGLNDAYFDVREARIDGMQYKKTDMFNYNIEQNLKTGKNIIFEITGANIRTLYNVVNTVITHTKDCDTDNTPEDKTPSIGQDGI